jgi:hypothetical protein
MLRAAPALARPEAGLVMKSSKFSARPNRYAKLFSNKTTNQDAGQGEKRAESELGAFEACHSLEEGSSREGG